MKTISEPAESGIASIRRTVFFIVWVLASIFCLVFGTFSLKSGFPVMAIVDYATFVGLSGITILAYRRPSSKIPYNLLVILTTSFFFFYFLSGGYKGTGHLWILLVPLIAPFFMGWQYGMATSLFCLLLGVGIVIVERVYGFFPALPENATAIRLATIYVISLVVSCLYDYGTVKINRKLSESEEKISSLYHDLVETSQDLIWQCDWKGRIVNLNPAWKDVLGYDMHEMLGKTFSDFQTPERAHKDGEAFGRLIEGNTVKGFETVYLHKNGSEVNLVVNAKSLHNPEGTFTGTRGTAYDITELRRAESLFINAQKLESLGVLAGGIAHDFNNLLTGIFGNIQIAALETGEESTSHHLATACAAMERARGLTRQLLTFAKGGAPTKKVEQLSTFIEETVKFALSGSNTLCRLNIPEYTWPCDIDRNQIEQVIDNIVINAQQAMPEGGTIELAAENVVLTETHHPILSAGYYVKILIKDQGAGMPKEILPKIFDPFFTTKVKGHGLGLATCYSIMRRHNGYIEAETEQGRGTTITIYLPAVPGGIAAAESSAGEVSSYKGRGEVLIMDDEEVIRKTLTSMLKVLGHTTVCVSNGEEVIERLFSNGDHGEIVAVILDLTVPGAMGGKETIRTIRQRDGDIPVFVASGYADDPVLAHPEKYGFNASIYKPFSITELAVVFRKHLEG